MAIRVPFQSVFRFLLIAAVPIAVSACAAVSPTGKPPAGTATFIAPVFPGDTMTTVAARYGVSVNELLALNSVKDPNRRLSRGQALVPISARARVDVAQPMAAPVEPAVAAPFVPPTQPRPPAIETRSLAPLPAPPPRSSRRPSSAIAVPAAPAVASATQPTPQSPAAADSQSPTAMDSMWDWLIPETPPIAASTNHHMLWPVEGRVISPFGDNPNGGRNDGINIAAARGTPVRAADAGEVSYVGNELKGYGNLILIRHDNGFITAYAHADSVHVKRGERVERGQIIGSTGDTGNVSQPQLHFELRRGTTPVDPTPYLVTPPPRSGERLAERAR